MFELKRSPYIPGREISTSYKELYHIYIDGKIVDRTLYSTISASRNINPNFIILEKCNVEEISPRIFNACREHNKHYPKYHIRASIVVVNKRTGKIILDTKQTTVIQDYPILLNDYIFKYKDKLYNINGEYIWHAGNKIHVLENVILIIESRGYTDTACYVLDKTGNLITQYK